MVEKVYRAFIVSVGKMSHFSFVAQYELRISELFRKFRALHSTAETLCFLSVWQLLFYVWKYAVTRLGVVGRWAIRYRGLGCSAALEEDSG